MVLFLCLFACFASGHPGNWFLANFPGVALHWIWMKSEGTHCAFAQLWPQWAWGGGGRGKSWGQRHWDWAPALPSRRVLGPVAKLLWVSVFLIYKVQWIKIEVGHKSLLDCILVLSKSVYSCEKCRSVKQGLQTQLSGAARHITPTGSSDREGSGEGIRANPEWMWNRAAWISLRIPICNFSSGANSPTWESEEGQRRTLTVALPLTVVWPRPSYFSLWAPFFHF